MKPVLLHGAGIISSRHKLISLKSVFDPNNILVYGSGVSIQEIKTELASSSLFSGNRLVILENPPEDFNYTLYPIPYTLVFWFDHEISNKSPIIDWIKKNNGQIIYFPESKEVSIFPFLDLLAASNNKAFVEMEKLKKANYDSQYFITMIFYLLRNLAVTPNGAKEFVRQKNARMRTNFPKDRIIKLYASILDLDFKLKKGLMENDQAQFSLVNLFTN